jgi:nucleoid-associated protein YgaU
MTNAEREKVILTLGNVEGVGSVADEITVTNPEPESTFHEVKSGDTLSKISKEVYGDPMKYNMIFEANQPMLSHPDKIYPGQILRIPVL